MTGLVTKANSIATPVGFNPRDPASVAAAFAALPTNGRDVYGICQSGGAGIIGPALEVERLEISTGPSLVVVETLYALSLPAESFSLATGGVAEVFAGGVAPAVVVTIEGLAPMVVRDAAVAVPSAGVTVTAHAPAVFSGASVAIPAAGVTVQGIAPDWIGVPTTLILVPTAGVSVAGAATVVSTGVAVVVPAADVSVAGVVPSSIGTVSIPVNNITYSQSSLWSGTTAANNSIMTDKAFDNTGAATNANPAWVQMDLGSSYAVAKVVIGTATSSIPGGWNNYYTQNRNVQYSTDGSTWTTAFNTGTFASNGIYTFDVNFTARYIRITVEGTGLIYVAISEFYALAPGQTY